MQAEVIAIGNRPNGRNINDGCGSVHAEEMRATVIRDASDSTSSRFRAWLPVVATS